MKRGLTVRMPIPALFTSMSMPPSRDHACVDRPGHRRLVSYVQLDADRPRQVGGDRARTLAGPAGQRDRRSRRGQGGGHGESQSARPAGHQHLHRNTPTRTTHPRSPAVLFSSGEALTTTTLGVRAARSQAAAGIPGPARSAPRGACITEAARPQWMRLRRQHMIRMATICGISTAAGAYGLTTHPARLHVSSDPTTQRRQGRTFQERAGLDPPAGSQVATVTGVGGLLDLSTRRLVPDPRQRFRELATDLGPLNL